MLTSGNSIQLDCLASAGSLQESCTCGDSTDLPPIKTINMIGPDASGQFFLAGNSCLTVSPVANGLELDDVCSQPCCGCSELAVIQGDLANLFGELNTLTAQLLRMEQLMVTTRDHLLVAKTSLVPICGG